MDRTRQTTDALADELSTACSRALGATSAAELLRTAVLRMHEMERDLETLAAAIAKAEIVLAYGPTGRPARTYLPTFGYSPDQNRTLKYDIYGQPLPS